MHNAFMKPIPPGQHMAAVYLSLDNATDVEKRLNYVHTPVAENIEVHRNVYDNGLVQMRQVKHLRIKPKEKIHFKPGGYHLMLFGVYDELKVDDTFELTLEFEDGTVIKTAVSVRPLG